MLYLFYPERLQTFTSETKQKRTFGKFIQYHDYEPERLRVSDSWTGWKARARLAPVPSDPDLTWLKKSSVRKGKKIYEKENQIHG